jgi:ribosomal-protein-alanine N-acetyltransferase
MEESDLDDVLAIERASFPTPWSRDNFLHELRENRWAANLVARSRGALVGFACAWVLPPEIKINNVAVAPGWRRRGVGGVLLESLLRIARDGNCVEATLEVRPTNRAARILYLRYGFRDVGYRKGYYADTGEDAVLMTLDLERPGPGGQSDGSDR